MSDDFNIEDLFPKVIAAINRVGYRFDQYKGLIISESDLKCQIYSELRLLINEGSQTFDEEIKGSPIHSEVAFYNSNDSNNADMPVDLVLFDTSEFSLLKDPKFRIENGRITNGLPGKQYRTLGDTILIELKLNKTKGGITKSFKNSVVKDIDKLDEVIQFNSQKLMKGICVIFNKTSRYCDEFRTEVLELNRTNIEVIYRTSNIEFYKSC